MRKSSKVGPEFMDGAVLHNNPVEVALAEVAALSEQEELNRKPDFILSIGTGVSDVSRSETISQPIRSKGGVSRSDTISQQIRSKGGAIVPQRTPWLSKMFFIVQYQIKLNIDAERRWKRIEESNADLKGHLFRLNPDFGTEPPELDDVEAMPKLITDTANLLSADKDLAEKMHEAACAIVASSFYFEKSVAPTTRASSSTELRGQIRCRFDDSQDIRQLGLFIQKALQSQFVISSYPEHFEDMRTPVCFENMIAEGTFPPMETSVNISGDGDTTKIELRIPGICAYRSNFPISGFPRQLMKMDFRPV